MFFNFGKSTRLLRFLVNNRRHVFFEISFIFVSRTSYFVVPLYLILFQNLTFFFINLIFYFVHSIYGDILIAKVCRRYTDGERERAREREIQPIPGDI